jgi:maleamate amidohydrolase
MSDTDIYRQQNFGNRLGFGRRAALLIIDFTVGFNDPAMFGGGNIDAAIIRTAGLLDFFRSVKLPIVYTRVVYADDGSDANLLTHKVPALLALTEAHPAGQIVPALAPGAGELVVRKTHASAFFDTGLAAWLDGQQVDTLVVSGCTTSGCVRASVVDANAHGFRPIVARDCVGDRAIGPHDASLFDMEQKYADVMDRDQVIAELSKL